MIETDVFEGFGLAIQKTYAAQHGVDFSRIASEGISFWLSSGIDLPGFFAIDHDRGTI
jgi:hypothetical protein